MERRASPIKQLPDDGQVGPTVLECGSALAKWWDVVFMQICVSYVRMAMATFRVPVVGPTLRRLTFMSGSNDTNANLCLFMRLLYCLLPEALAYDKREVEIGFRFLEVQYKVLYYLVKVFGFRVMPPMLRPLFVTYYGRARQAEAFVHSVVHDKGVRQVVIMGAGFDCTAYRIRAERISHPHKFVKVYEVDLPHVQERKLQYMRESMKPAEFLYYTEGVEYLPCDFATQSVGKVLQDAGLDTTQSLAIVWEGVTYYLPMEAITKTLSEIEGLYTAKAPVKDDLELDEAATSLNGSTGCNSEDATQPAACYLFIDYMHQGTTLTQKADSWLWRLEQELNQVLGTPFITGVADIQVLLAQYGFNVTRHVTRAEIQSEFLTYRNDLVERLGKAGAANSDSSTTNRRAATSQAKPSSPIDVFFESNSTAGHCEPNLRCVEAVRMIC